ncbi:uncharacterized protein BT62DRAFT_1076903, partial [Guyanagaster necrorhizus]
MSTKVQRKVSGYLQLRGNLKDSQRHTARALKHENVIGREFVGYRRTSAPIDYDDYSVPYGGWNRGLRNNSGSWYGTFTRQPVSVTKEILNRLRFAQHFGDETFTTFNGKILQFKRLTWAQIPDEQHSITGAVKRPSAISCLSGPNRRLQHLVHVLNYNHLISGPVPLS